MKSMNVFPDDVLCIRYKELAAEAQQRLLLLHLIGKLLHKSAGSYTKALLQLDNDAWSLLYHWLEQEYAVPFWHAEYNNIIVEQQCDKHIIVGTEQLLGDLKVLVCQCISEDSFDDIWSTAQYWVSTALY
jgi:hypothetical protein